MDDMKNKIENIVKNFIASTENNMEKWENEPVWAEPLVGFSNGSDPLYPFYKKDIGSFYLSPLELISNEFPDKIFNANKLTVISWILPQTEATKKDHRKETHFPSERWARARIIGEKINFKLRQHVVKKLKESQIEAVAPMISPLWKSSLSEKYGYASTWSERHAAFASGLGTFGLSDGLITPAGKAMRTGSVVANIYLEPTPRPYENHTAYCLFHQKGTCGECIGRCPIGAITWKGHNKILCNKYINMTEQYIHRHLGLDGYGCGFCQTATPCESAIPKELIPGK
jgi:ferredoxin